MPSVNNIFFDLDGTLCDPCSSITGTINEVLQHYQLPTIPEADLVHYVGPPLTAIFSELLPENSPETVSEAVAYYRSLYNSIHYQRNRLYPHVEPLLIQLKEAGKQLAIVTTKLQATADLVIDHLNIRGYFCDVCGSGRFTDKCAAITYLIKTFDLSANDAIMVGDRESDFSAATAAGVKSLGVTWGYGSPAELALADATADTPQHLLNLLR